MNLGLLLFLGKVLGDKGTLFDDLAEREFVFENNLQSLGEIIHSIVNDGLPIHLIGFIVEY